MPRTGTKLNISQEERQRRVERANHARNYIDRDKQAEAASLVGKQNAANGHLDEIRSPKICSLGGRTTRDRGVGAMALNQNVLHQRDAGKVGGKVQGTENARIGWMRHIALDRHGKPHADCEYCINQRLLPPAAATE
jgi:hypothetical protein